MSTSTPLPDRIAGRYEPRALLGSGAMGTVWRAWDTVLGREVAVKRVRHETGGRAEPVDGLLREASLLASLQHPNIVTAYDAGVEGKVLRIGESKSGDVLYVNFSDQYRQAVSLVVFVDPAQKEEIKAGLERRVSTRVRASGPLEDYKGALQVRLRGAEYIQVAPDPSK